MNDQLKEIVGYWATASDTAESYAMQKAEYLNQIKQCITDPIDWNDKQTQKDFKAVIRKALKKNDEYEQSEIT